MIYYALVFLIVGLVAGALGLFGIAAIAGQISWGSCFWLASSSSSSIWRAGDTYRYGDGRRPCSSFPVTFTGRVTTTRA